MSFLPIRNVCYGVIVWFPSKGRTQVLDGLHVGFQEAICMKELPRNYEWRPKIDAKIE